LLLAEWISSISLDQVTPSIHWAYSLCIPWLVCCF
jgi:hypothetical protein